MIANANGVGFWDEQDSTMYTDRSSVIEVFYFAAACTAGDLVMVDYATTTRAAGQTIPIGQALKTSTATANLPIVGVVLETLTAAGDAKVCVEGTVKAKASGLTQGDLVRSDTTAGQATTATAGTHHVIGETLTTTSGGFSVIRLF